MKATKPLLLAAIVLALVIVLFPLGGCADDSTQTMAGDTQNTSTASVEATAMTRIETTTTQAPTTTEFTTTTTTLPAGGSGPAEVVASVSLDGSVYEEDWGAIPCTCEDEKRNEYQGTKVVKTTVRVCDWQFWVRLTEKNGVGVTFKSLGFHSVTPTGELTSQDWGDTGVELSPHGSYERGFVVNSEDSGPAKIMTGAPLPLELGASIVVVTYAGTDANGNEVLVEIPVELDPAY